MRLFSIFRGWSGLLQSAAAISTVLLATLTITLLIVRPFTDDSSAEPDEKEPEIPLVFTEGEPERGGLYNVLSDATPGPDPLTQTTLPDPVPELIEGGDSISVCPPTNSLPVERLFFASAPGRDGGGMQDGTIHLEFDISSVALEETVVVDRLAARVVDFASEFNTRVAHYSCAFGGGAAAAIIPRLYEGQLDGEGETELSPVDASAQAGYILEPDQILSLEADLQPITEGRYSFQIVVYYHTSAGEEGTLLSPTTHQFTYVASLTEDQLYPLRPPAQG